MKEKRDIDIVQLSLSIARKEQIDNIPTEEIKKIPPIGHICRCLIVNIVTDFGNSFANVDIDNLENSARFLTKIIIQGKAKTRSELSFLKSKNFAYGIPQDFDQRFFSDSTLFCSSEYNLSKAEGESELILGHSIENYSEVIYSQLVTIINQIIQSAL